MIKLRVLRWDIIQALNAITHVLKRNRQREIRHIQRRKQCELRAERNFKILVLKALVRQPQAMEYQQPPKTTIGKDCIITQASGASANLPTP